MGRKSELSAEMAEAAGRVVKTTKNADELRRSLSVVLSVRLGLALPVVGGLIGRSRATVVRYHNQFSDWYSGLTGSVKNWGGRRRAYLTFDEEKELVAEFFEQASKGGMLVVSEVHKALEKRVGHRVAETTVYRMLARHGWRKIVPRRKHPKSNERIQEGFKKNSKSK